MASPLSPDEHADEERVVASAGSNDHGRRLDAGGLWHTLISGTRREFGNPLEVMGVEADDGVFIVVHAMKLRAAYQAEYVEVNGNP